MGTPFVSVNSGPRPHAVRELSIHVDSLASASLQSVRGLFVLRPHARRTS